MLFFVKTGSICNAYRLINIVVVVVVVVVLEVETAENILKIRTLNGAF